MAFALQFQRLRGGWYCSFRWWGSQAFLTPVGYDARMSYDIRTFHLDKLQDCYDSDRNYDPVRTDFVTNDNPADGYYRDGKLPNLRKKVSPPTKTPTSTEVKHCQFCFFRRQPIKVMISHNDMDIVCPSMSFLERSDAGSHTSMFVCCHEFNQ